jgi:cytochrome c biogenesis protein CcdA
VTTGMLLGILGLAILESLNPSALVVTIALLSRPNPATRIFAYAAGIFVVFFSLGVAAVLGGDGVLNFFKDLRGHHFAYVLQLPIGLGLIGWAWWWLKRPPVLDQPSRLSNPPQGPVWGVFLLGLGVTLVEALTAFPYFGAIAILLDAEIPKHESIMALVAFNLLFITPPLLLLWITSTLGRRAPAFLERLRQFIELEGRLLMLWLFIIIGAYLTLDAIRYFA